MMPCRERYIPADTSMALYSLGYIDEMMIDIRSFEFSETEFFVNFAARAIREK